MQVDCADCGVGGGGGGGGEVESEGGGRDNLEWLRHQKIRNRKSIVNVDIIF